jgi:adenine phosphoribosyltransferase
LTVKEEKEMELTEYIASIPDFPKEGIIFRDITPILTSPKAIRHVTRKMADFIEDNGANLVLAPEARGFFFGIPAAVEADVAFAPVRKPGKLPRETIRETYDLEYGTDTLEIHADAIQPGDKVVVVDDLLATGGTVEAIMNLARKQGAEVVGAAFVVELDDLKGRDRFKDIPVLSLVHYEGE